MPKDKSESAARSQDQFAFRREKLMNAANSGSTAKPSNVKLPPKTKSANSGSTGGDTNDEVKSPRSSHPTMKQRNVTTSRKKIKSNSSSEEDEGIAWWPDITCDFLPPVISYGMGRFAHLLILLSMLLGTDDSSLSHISSMRILSLW
eukprot:CAMPEP_0201868886 /NCGR_PEP_ID=MMETSP0902-20130614/2602_1 /ASSEMBLY_ACC=CAM_ASM_000551 /TAXON_ID=420261 /ORGANISM="Thalassiosira antarctica, Strain CCMP982" /LENGTH=146 /DNA_ID=CAMNT_0048394287 /DNA_START=309 /DNA_END=746 /DNA_ORIENTATION=-